MPIKLANPVLSEKKSGWWLEAQVQYAAHETGSRYDSKVRGIEAGAIAF
jgi:hypothetical protein